jgi:group I intron endonuclease
MYKLIIGIYKIQNKINNKIYIGQSWNIKSRWNQHKKSNSTHEHNEHLYNAFKKYGIENFDFFILIQFKDGPFTQKYLDKFEKYYIIYYDSMNNKKGYNKKEGGSRGKVSEEAKIKMSKAQKGKIIFEDTRKKISITTKGIPKGLPSEETKLKMRQRHKDFNGVNNPFYNKKHSEKTKQKIGSYHKGKINSIEILEKMRNNLKKIQENNKIKVKCLETNKIYNSLKEAGEDNNIDPQCISKCCKGIFKSSGGFHWVFI